MFNGEFESLKAIEESQTIKVPHPIAVLENPTGGGHMLVMEHLDLKHCSEQTKLGTKLAEYVLNFFIIHTICIFSDFKISIFKRIVGQKI